MKLITAMALLTATVYGAGIGDLPTGSQQCIKDGAKKVGCEGDDLACLCKNLSTIQSDEAQCVIDACGMDVAVNQVLPAAKKLCAGQ